MNPDSQTHPAPNREPLTIDLTASDVAAIIDFYGAIAFSVESSGGMLSAALNLSAGLPVGRITGTIWTSPQDRSSAPTWKLELDPRF